MLGTLFAMPEGEVSGTCMTLLGAMGLAVASMGVFIVKMLLRHRKDAAETEEKHRHEISALYDTRIAELKEGHNLMNRLLEFVGGGKGDRP